MKILKRVLLLVVCCVLIWPLTPFVEEAQAAKGLLFPIEQVSEPAVSGNTIQYSNTTRNIAVAMDGKIYVVYRNANGIYVNSSIDRGETMGTPVRVSTDTQEPEIAVSTNGTLYVSWINSSGVKFSRSTDGGQTFSTPETIGTEVTSSTVHMATDGLHVYIFNRNGTYLYVSHDSGQNFSTKTFPSSYVYSDVMVDRQTHEVIVQKDNPSIRYYKSSDYGETFGSATDPGSSVYYSVGALGTDGINTYYYVSGQDTNLQKINIATGADQTLNVPSSSQAQGRSISADDYGNLVVGYIDESNNLIFQESNNSGATFEDTVTVDNGSYSSAAINHTTGDILYAYEKAGQIYLAVYGEYLEGYVLNISHAALSFAGQLVNTASAYKTVTLTNDGETPITINSIVVSAPFTIEDASLSSIPVGGSADIRIRYEPTTVGDHSGTAVITYEGTDTKTINLSGTAVAENPLSISSIANQSLNSADAPKLVSFTVSHTDGSFDFNNLVLSATSTDQTLVPNGNMSFSGSDGSYTLSITPAAGQSGTCEITVFANDLVNEVSEPFELSVTVTYNVRIEDADHSLIDLRSIIGGQAVSSDGGAVSDPSAPAHYSFGGWDDGSTIRTSAEVSSYVPTENKTFTATYDIDQHTITMNENGGSTISDITKDYNATINQGDIGTTTQTGYDFDAWYEDDVTFASPVSFPHTVVADDTWYANWTPTDYNITYNLDSGTNDGSNPASYTIESATVTFADASKVGYDFGGWFTDSGCTSGNEITEIAAGSHGDVEVWAKWTPTDYSITYNLDDSTNDVSNPASYTIESATITFADPSKDGYTFDGWFTDENCTAGNEITEIAAGSFGNVEVWAKLTPIDYNITYNLDGGTNHDRNPAIYTIESNLILLAEPEREGYLFSGWFTSADFAEGTEITEITSGSMGDVEVWVKWTKIDAEDDSTGIVMGNISTTGGQGQAGLAVTLKSSPRTTFTDVNGDFSFEHVIFEDHQLVITNSAGIVIGEYDLEFSQGNETSVNIRGTTAYITYTNNSVAVQIDISVNEAGTRTALESVTVISNPQTGVYITTTGERKLSPVITFLSVILLLGAAGFIIHKRKHHKHYSI